MARVDSFLRLVVEQDASDLHFLAGSPPTIRHHGDIRTVPFRILSDTETRRFLYEILSEEQKAQFEQGMELDFAYEIPGLARFRGNMFVQNDGVGAVFRVINEAVPQLDKMRLPGSLRRILELNGGLVLFTGPTGCGKSTTQAALVNEFNRTRACHILTVEDPIEVVHKPLLATVTQREVGRDVPSFANALRTAPRQQPDLLLVGELRDAETMSLILGTAETGVLAFGTLHTNSAAATIDRIVDAFPKDQAEQMRGLLAATLKAVVAQRLLKLANGAGRVAIFEVLFNNPAIANLIRLGKTHQVDSILQSAAPGSGMQSFDRNLARLLRERRISMELARANARYPDNLPCQSPEQSLAA